MNKTIACHSKFAYFEGMRFFYLGIFLILFSCASRKSSVDFQVDTLPTQELQAAAQPFLENPIELQWSNLQSDVSIFNDSIASNTLRFRQLKSLLTDAFFTTGAFRFIEGDSAHLQSVLTQWALAQSGTSESLEAKPIGLPDYIVDIQFIEVSHDQIESVHGAKSLQGWITSIGIQIKLISVNDGSYYPAMGASFYMDSSTAWLGVSDADFSKSALANATNKAIQKALLQLLQRIPPKGNK